MRSQCSKLKMLPLILEDEAELECFAKNAKEHLEGKDFWISAARFSNLNKGVTVTKWCLPDSKETLFANTSNLEVELNEDGYDQF